MSARLEALRGQLPRGAGLGYRPELADAILAHHTAIDLVELLVDDVLDLPVRKARRALRPVLEALPVVAHGVRLSVGSAEGIDRGYVERIARLLDGLGIEIYSEHLSFTRAGAHETAQFMPLPFTEAFAERVAANVREVQRITGRTLLLENITWLLGRPHEGMGEAAFIAHVLEAADCALLLDVSNVLINAANLGFPIAPWLAQLPRERILAAHIAGGHHDPGLDVHLDSHGHPVPPEALSLLGRVASAGTLCCAVLERDRDYPDFAELLGEVAATRAALRSGAPPAAPDQEPARLPATAPLPGLAGALAAMASPAALQAEMTRALCAGPEVAGSAWLASFPRRHVAAFRRVLGTKRRDRAAGRLPGLFAALEARGELAAWLQRWMREEPRQDLSSAAEALGFARLVAASDSLPAAIVDLARHESALVELLSQPWRPIVARRCERVLRHAPQALGAVARGAALPEPLPAPLRVRYERARTGVWVRVLGAARVTDATAAR